VHITRASSPHKRGAKWQFKIIEATRLPIFSPARINKIGKIWFFLLDFLLNEYKETRVKNWILSSKLEWWVSFHNSIYFFFLKIKTQIFPLIIFQINELIFKIYFYHYTTSHKTDIIKIYKYFVSLYKHSSHLSLLKNYTLVYLITLSLQFLFYFSIYILFFFLHPRFKFWRSTRNLFL